MGLSSSPFTEPGRSRKRQDVIAVAVMAAVWLADSIIADRLWGAKRAPFVVLTWGHLSFTLLHAGLPLLWFLGVRRYPPSYLGLNSPRRRFWYFVAPLGAVLGFGFGIPTYLLITSLLPGLRGGGMAGTPPPLGFPLPIVLLVEFFKYPLTSVIGHNLAYRGAVFQSLRSLGRGWFWPAVLISAGLYIAYHLPFDLSFSAVYFNLIWSLIALWLLVRSGSLYPPMIFHAAINIAAIFMSWGYGRFGN